MENKLIGGYKNQQTGNLKTVRQVSASEQLADTDEIILVKVLKEFDQIVLNLPINFEKKVLEIHTDYNRPTIWNHNILIVGSNILHINELKNSLNLSAGDIRYIKLVKLGSQWTVLLPN